MSNSLGQIRAELLKLSSIRTFWWTVTATLAFVPAGVSFAILGSGRKGNASLDSTERFRNAIASGSVGGILLIVLGTMAVLTAYSLGFSAIGARLLMLRDIS